MEVEERLLTAIDQLAKEGTAEEIRLLAALLACRGKVEMLRTGWQSPFRGYAELAQNGFDEALRGLIGRGIVVQHRRPYRIALNSYIISRNKDFVSFRCANRLFTRAHHRFAKILREIPYAVLRDMCRLQSVTAVNRAYRNLTAQQYRGLKVAGLLVWNGRANPCFFPSLNWVEDVPWATAVALTLREGNALTWANMVSECGMAFHMALATGHIVYDGETKEVALTAPGEELALAYRDTAIRRRLRWVSNCRTEAMHALIDELEAPLPAVWVKGRASQVDRAWIVQREAPLRILLKDPTLRQWFRRLVRSLMKMGLAQLIHCHDQGDWFFFAPGIPRVAKEVLDLPEERFSLPEELQAQVMAGCHLLGITRKQDGTWWIRPDLQDPALPPGAAERISATLGRLKFQRRVKGPDEAGAYRIYDGDTYRWAVVEELLDPAAEFLTFRPEEEGAVQPPEQHATHQTP
ncbi:MAG: hypothetical protein ACOY93_14475 [Bacillota bacterium]